MRITDKFRGISKEERQNLNIIKKSAYYGTKSKLDKQRKTAKQMRKLEAQKRRAEKAALTGKKLAMTGRGTKVPKMPKMSFSGKRAKIGAWAERKSTEHRTGQLDSFYKMSFDSFYMEKKAKRKKGKTKR